MLWVHAVHGPLDKVRECVWFTGVGAVRVVWCDAFPPCCWCGVAVHGVWWAWYSQARELKVA